MYTFYKYEVYRFAFNSLDWLIWTSLLTYEHVLSWMLDFAVTFKWRPRGLQTPLAFWECGRALLSISGDGLTLHGYRPPPEKVRKWFEAARRTTACCCWLLDRDGVPVFYSRVDTASIRVSLSLGDPSP